MTPLLLPVLLALGSPQTPRAPEPPPGLVFIPGGRTKIGIDQKELERLLEADLNSQNYAGALSAETPRQEMAIESFFSMATEVTNEQYAAYVRATGARPPESWAQASIAAGRDTFAAEQERAKSEALAHSRPVPEPVPFDAHAWWIASWRAWPWEVPAGDELRPVVFVDWKDARAYARWAGLRLPSEFELQRAARGDSDRVYPWGNEWDNEKYAATSLLKKKSGAFPVGSFPLGATRQGLFDLSGNVWEWTSSPYTPYPGYEHKVYAFGFGTKARQVNAVADWNAEQRVVCGGSFQNGNLMARASTRRAADATQAADALGFRCAASVRPGADMSSAILEGEITPNIRPRDGEGMIAYAPEATVGADAWTSAASRTSGAPVSYGVITGHRFALFTPVKLAKAADIGAFERLSLSDAPVPIGIFATNMKLAEPALAPGTYLVSYRARGLRKYASTDATGATKPIEGAPLEEALSLDVNFDHIVFFDLDGQPVRALRQTIVYGPWREGRATIVDADAAPQTDAPATPADKVMRLDICLPCRTTKKGLSFALALRFEAGALDGSWRR